MSDNKETVQIVIDDRGVATQVRQVSGEINKIGDSATKANKSLENMGSKIKTPKGLMEVSRELGVVATAAKMTGAQIDDLQKRMSAVSSKRAMENALKELARNADLSASEVKKLAKEIGIADRSMKEFANSMGPKLSLAMKAGIAGAVGASVMLLKSFIANTIEAEQAQAQLQAALRSTGEAAGFSQTKLNEMANQMAKTTTYSVSEIAKAQTVMTTYSNVVGDNFTRAMQVVADQSSRLGISMQQSAEMIGRAIDVPAEGMNSLVRQGFRFTQAQKDIVKELQETGRVMEAQGYVLDALEESYGGSADAARNTFGGALQSLKSAIEEITTGREGSFSAATDGVNAFADALRDQGTRDAINELIGLVGQLAAGLASIAKYATLRSVSATFGEGAALAKKGLIDWDEFKSASFMVRQEMVDAVQDTAKIAGKHAGAIWQQFEKEGMAAYNQFTYQTEDLFEQSRRKANETLKAGLQTQREALDEQYEFLKKHADDKAGVEKWYQEQVAKLDAKGSKQRIATAKKTTQSLKELYAALFQDVDPRTQMEFETYLKEAEEAAKEKLKLEEKLAEEKLKLEEDAAKEALKIQEDKEKEGLRIMERIQDATADIFYDLFQDIGKGWDKLWQSMKNWALRMMAELAAKAAMTKIAMPIVMTLTGAGTAQAAMQTLGGLGGGGGFNLSSLGSLFQPGSMLSKIPGFGAVSSILGTTLPGTATALASAFSGVGANTALYATGLGFSPNAVAQGALQGVTLGGQPIVAAPVLSSGLSLGSALGMGSIGGLGYSLLGGALELPTNKWSGLTASLGGTLGAWGGSALGGILGGAAAGSVVPIIGTAVGALAGGLLSSVFGGKKEHSPSVIFQGQDIGWGQTTGYQFHTKSGAKKETGDQIAKALGDVSGTIFEEVEGFLSALGDGYVDKLKEATVRFGRKTEGRLWTWDFGSDHDFEKMFQQASEDIQKQIYTAAAPVISMAGVDFLGSETVGSAFAILEDAEAQFAKLIATTKAGVQSGDIQSYAESLQAFQQSLLAITTAWATISQASAELITPLTQYEAAQRAINAQYDEWTMQLAALGVATEKINQIEADRETLLQRLYDDSQKAIADVMRASANVVQPLKEYEQAQIAIGDQYDAWIEQLRQLGATLEQTQALEADREQALKNLQAQNQKSINNVLRSAYEMANPLSGLEAQLRSINNQFDTWRDTLAQLGATVAEVTALEQQRTQALLAAKKAQAEADLRAAYEAMDRAQQQAASDFERQLTAMTASLIGAYNYEVGKLDKIIANHTQEISDAHGVLAEAYNRESEELRQLSDRFAFLGKQISDWITSFWSGTQSPLGSIEKAALLLDNFRKTMNAALGGDEEAFGALPGAAGDYLSVARATTASRADYARLSASITKQMEQAEAAALNQKSVADLQLEALERQAAAVDGILETTITFAKAFENYRQLMLQSTTADALSQKEALRAQLASLGLLGEISDSSKDAYNEQLNAQKATLKAQINTLSKMDELAKETSLEQAKQLQAQLNTVKKLESLTAEQKAALEKQLQAQLNTLTAQKTAASATATSLAGQLRAQIDTIAILESMDDKSDKAYTAQLRSQKDALQAQLSMITAIEDSTDIGRAEQVKQLQAQLNTVDSLKNLTKEQKEALTKQLQAQIDTLNAQKSAAGASASSLAAQLKAQLNTVDSLNNLTAEQKDALKKQLQKQIETVTAIEKESQKGLSEQIKIVNAQIQTANNIKSMTAEQKTAYASQLSAQLDTAKAQRDSTTALKAEQIKQLQAQLAAVDSIKGLTAEQKTAMKTQLQAQIDTLNAQKSAASTSSATLTAQLKAQLDSVKEMQTTTSWTKQAAEYQKLMKDGQSGYYSNVSGYFGDVQSALQNLAKINKEIAEKEVEIDMTTIKDPIWLVYDAILQTRDYVYDAGASLSSVMYNVGNHITNTLWTVISNMHDIGGHLGGILSRGLGVSAYASGGFHDGGLRLVGEHGPELESTGPSRIWSADETRSILMGGGQSALVLEIAQLRSDLQSANFAIAKNTSDTARMLRRWDGDGMPEERAM